MPEARSKRCMTASPAGILAGVVRSAVIRMKRWQPSLLAILLAAGCTTVPGGGDRGEGAGGSGPTFIDGDGGTGCARPSEGCACEPGQPPIDCYLEAERGDDGRITCSRGTRYCRDSRWTSCESIEQYALRAGAGIAPLVTGPTSCNPCDPGCAVSRDIPAPADLPGRSHDLDYDPGAGGIILRPEEGTTRPELPDSDGDGIPDVADDCDGPGAFEAADGSCYGDTFFYHELPFGGPTVLDSLDLQVTVRTADVYFLMDTTGSMGGAINNLKSDLTSGTFIAGCSGGIIGAIRCTIPDAWFGVGYHDDYPVAPYGYASYGDRVYEHLRDISASVSATQSGVNALTLHYGGDGPESQSQALWAVATGGGLGSYLAARTTCPAGTWGYPCWREGTIPIVILFTDAPFHNGPFGYDYSFSGTGYPVSWAQTVDALNASGVRVITVHSGGTYGLADARALADATSSYSSSGARYVFSIAYDGTGLSSAVVDAVVDLANYNRMDISARAIDNPATPGIDERGFVQSITAVSWGPGSCQTISGGHTFIQCLPGTTVDFRVAFQNDFVMPTMEPQVFDFWIEVVGDGSFVLERIPVRILVPPELTLYPASGSYWRDYDSTLYCTATERPDWNELTWEIAELPEGTSVRWELRTATTAAGIEAATPVTFTTPPTTPPVDVGTRLTNAGQSNFLPHLRVTAVLLSNSTRTATPVLRSFELRYNCIPSE
jgi:hypothetical protein